MYFTTVAMSQTTEMDSPDRWGCDEVQQVRVLWDIETVNWHQVSHIRRVLCIMFVTTHLFNGKGGLDVLTAQSLARFAAR